MAIPVSMSLPEKFQHVDLSSVADKSSLLVGRYRKPSEVPATGLGSQAALAKALESLANSIGLLEARLGRQDQAAAAVSSPPPPPPTKPGAELPPDPPRDDASAPAVPEPPLPTEPETEPANENGFPSATPQPESESAGDSDVVQLNAGEEQDEAFRGKSKSNPLGAQVLVRREAAREAHAFRREKHSQADWDEHAAQRTSGPTGFAWLMDRFPKTTVLLSMVMVGFLIAATIIWMDSIFATPTAPSKKAAVAVQTTSLGELMKDDPEAATAEIVARGFLNATSLEAAAPFVFQSDAIETKLASYYQPISAPGDYELSFKHRALGGDGRSQFLYNVELPGERPRMLVILPEGAMPKVFWEFFAEVGDISWGAFMKEQPQDPVEMRVWVYPGEVYVDGYNEQDWQSYVLHDFAEDHRIYAYADRGAIEDWRIADALANDPVQFKRHSAVMALVKLIYMAELPLVSADPEGAAVAGETVTVAEIKDVLATSWLPKQFQPVRD